MADHSDIHFPGGKTVAVFRNGQWSYPEALEGITGVIRPLYAGTDEPLAFFPGEQRDS
jgi:hypothetical protein